MKILIHLIHSHFSGHFLQPSTLFLSFLCYSGELLFCLFFSDSASGSPLSTTPTFYSFWVYLPSPSLRLSISPSLHITPFLFLLDPLCLFIDSYRPSYSFMVGFAGRVTTKKMSMLLVRGLRSGFFLVVECGVFGGRGWVCVWWELILDVLAFAVDSCW